MKHFTLAEFVKSSTADKLGIKNDPTFEHQKNIHALVENVLDPLRELVGYPIKINSGYRSKALNTAVKGSATSQHCLGQAADIICPKLTAEKLYQLIKDSGLDFDQLIQEFGMWVHVSYSAFKDNRMQCLRAVNVGNKVEYKPY
jgi:hypothetical protein